MMIEQEKRLSSFKSLQERKRLPTQKESKEKYCNTDFRKRELKKRKSVNRFNTLGIRNKNNFFSNKRSQKKELNNNSKDFKDRKNMQSSSIYKELGKKKKE